MANPIDSGIIHTTREDNRRLGVGQKIRGLGLTIVSRVVGVAVWGLFVLANGSGFVLAGEWSITPAIELSRIGGESRMMTRSG